MIDVNYYFLRIFSDIDGEPEGRYRQNVELIKRKEMDSNQIINSVYISINTINT